MWCGPRSSPWAIPETTCSVQLRTSWELCLHRAWQVCVCVCCVCVCCVRMPVWLSVCVRMRLTVSVRTCFCPRFGAPPLAPFHTHAHTYTRPSIESARTKVLAGHPEHSTAHTRHTHVGHTPTHTPTTHTHRFFSHTGATMVPVSWCEMQCSKTNHTHTHTHTHTRTHTHTHTHTDTHTHTHSHPPTHTYPPTVHTHFSLTQGRPWCRSAGARCSVPRRTRGSSERWRNPQPHRLREP